MKRVVLTIVGCLFGVNFAFSLFSPNLETVIYPEFTKIANKNYIDGYVVLPVLGKELTFARLSLLLGEDGFLYDFNGVTVPKKVVSSKNLSEAPENPGGSLKKFQKKDFLDNLLRAMTWDGEDRLAKRLCRLDCFHEVMGVYEVEFRRWSSNKEPKWGTFPPLEAIRKTKDGFVAEPVDKPLFGRAALYGSRFRALTIRSLKDTVDNAKKVFKPVGEGFFELIDGYKIKDAKGLKKALKLTDVAYLQEHNPGALFQIASTFNALEGGMGNDGCGYGRRLEEMQFTPTQGESAALASMGAAIIRKYCLQPINFLNGLVKGKKVVMNKKSGRDGLVWEVKKSLDSSDIEAIEVGIHSDVAVTSGYYGCFSKYLNGAFSIGNPDIKDRIAFLKDRNIVKKDREPFFVFNTRIDLSNPNTLIRVDQLFTAALKVEKNGSRGLDEKNARIVLEAAYQGTMYAAALRAIERSSAGVLVGRQKVFLTLVGAGAFGNEVSWIVDIFKKPWFEGLIKEFGLEVYLVIYPSPRPDRKMNLNDLLLLRQLESKLPQDKSMEKLSQALKAIAFS
ncbi:TPA: hypothetical protein DDZ86_04950 [Candidatus Dependentiae bacterium]|nr:MAG: hypothetical protein A2Y17_09755 [Clostridiales bacterium GWF2_38_85]HBL98959.1 hypothetical protein [Candidatus Dependentiae bacterium]